MSHGPHPSILEHGLADGCERCSEIAADPFVGLDDETLRLLVWRTAEWMTDTEFPRSAAERTAMHVVEKHLVRQRHLGRIGAVR